MGRHCGEFVKGAGRHSDSCPGSHVRPTPSVRLSGNAWTSHSSPTKGTVNSTEVADVFWQSEADNARSKKATYEDRLSKDVEITTHLPEGGIACEPCAIGVWPLRVVESSEESSSFVLDGE
jgi:hypothetical protein